MWWRYKHDFHPNEAQIVTGCPENVRQRTENVPFYAVCGADSPACVIRWFNCIVNVSKMIIVEPQTIENHVEKQKRHDRKQGYSHTDVKGLFDLIFVLGKVESLMSICVFLGILNLLYLHLWWLWYVSVRLWWITWLLTNLKFLHRGQKHETKKMLKGLKYNLALKSHFWCPDGASINKRDFTVVGLQ